MEGEETDDNVAVEMVEEKLMVVEMVDDRKVDPGVLDDDDDDDECGGVVGHEGVVGAQYEMESSSDGSKQNW